MASKEVHRIKKQNKFLKETTPKQQQQQQQRLPVLANKTKVVDIGVNLTHKSFKSNWKRVVQRSIERGVDTIILTGTSLKSSQQCLQMAQEWYDDKKVANLYFTVGVHPHEAKTWKTCSRVKDTSGGNDNEGKGHTCSTSSMTEKMREMLQHPLAVAVGECGLDYNRNFSSKPDQKRAFRAQLKLALELNMPLFLHEREAHQDFIHIIDEQLREEQELRGGGEDEDVSLPLSLPPAVVHCFTGVKEEALCYIRRGYFLGFTGTICKEERGRALREILPELPLDKLMVETDAPFMGFKGRKSSEPADCMDVARKLGEVIKVPFSTVCKTTTLNAMECFGIE